MTYTPPLFQIRIYSGILPELCEARGATQTNGKDGGSLGVSVFGSWGWVRTVWVCFSLFEKGLRDRLTNVLVSGTMGTRNGGFAVVPYLMQVLLRLDVPTKNLVHPSCTLPNAGIITYYSLFFYSGNKVQSLVFPNNHSIPKEVAPYLPRYHQTKKRNSTRVSLFAFYASVTKTFSFYRATGSKQRTKRSLR